MKIRSTGILLASVLVLGAFIWMQEAWRVRKPSELIRKIRMFNLNPESLIEIEFEHTNGVVRCVNENGVWMAGDSKGLSGRADVALMNRMIAGLNSMGKGTVITSEHLEMRGFDESQYGFDDPMVKIRAVDNEGEHRWLIGRKTPLGKMVYVKSGEGDNIYTISDKLLFIVPTSHDHLRDRVLFSGESASVRRIEIRGFTGLVQLVKDPASGWQLQQPVAGKADAKEVNLFIEKLYRFRIEHFEADSVSDLSFYGLQGESRQISIGNGDGSSRMLVIGDDVPDRPGFVYARRADDTSVFTLSADVLQLLNVPSERFRNPSILSVPLATISMVHVMHGNEKISLEIQNSKDWKLTTPVVWDAAAKSVSDVVVFLATAVVTDFDLGTNNIPAEWVFEVGSAEAGMTNRIEVLPSSGNKDGLYIRMNDDPAIYQINIPTIPNQVIDPLFYKDRRVWNLKKEGVNRISLSRNGGATRQMVERSSSNTFVPAETNGTVRVNDRACSTLLTQLEEVRATQYISYNPDNLEIYGLETPALELQVGLSNSNEIGRVLLVGRETPDGFYSMVKGRNVVFYLDKSLVQALSIDLFEIAEPVVIPSAE